MNIKNYMIMKSLWEFQYDNRTGDNSIKWPVTTKYQNNLMIKVDNLVNVINR